MKKAVLITLLFAGLASPMWAQNDYDDDIYYNPKKSQEKQQKKSNYIKNFDEIDVDTYNRRGQYYTTPIDTIGNATAYGEDFVNTQQIQKYINPTIVIDNADVLAGVLENSYGNVEIVIDDYGTPTFAPVYVYSDWPLYSYGWGPSWRWSWGWAPSWSISWNWGWGPSWGPAWGWDPYWAWGPSWGWGPGWGPSWGWGPGWGPGHGWHSDRYMANHYRPNAGRRPNGPYDGWADGTRPDGNRYGGTASSRPGYASSSSSERRPYSINSNGHRVSNQQQTINGAGSYRGSQGVGTHRSGYMGGTVNNGMTTGGHRQYGAGTGTTSTNGTFNGTATRRNYGIGTTTNRTGVTTNRSVNRSTNSNSSGYNNHRSSGNSNRSSFNSGSSHRSSGGFSTGGHGGGGSRGGGGGRSGGGGGGHRR